MDGKEYKVIYYYNTYNIYILYIYILYIYIYIYIYINEVV